MLSSAELLENTIRASSEVRAVVHEVTNTLVRRTHSPSSRRIERQLTAAIGALDEMRVHHKDHRALLRTLSEASHALRVALRDLRDAAPTHSALRPYSIAIKQALQELHSVQQELRAYAKRDFRNDLAELEASRRARMAKRPDIAPPRRKNVEIEVAVHWSSESNFFTGFSGDLTDGGLFIATYDILPRETELEVIFMLPPDGTRVVSRAVVQWTREASASEGVHPGYGVVLHDLKAPQRHAIANFMRVRQPIFYPLS